MALWWKVHELSFLSIIEADNAAAVETTFE